MAKYSDIKGFTVQTVSSDPVASQATGGAWASGGSLPAAKWIGNSAGTLKSRSRLEISRDSRSRIDSIIDWSFICFLNRRNLK